MAGRVHDPEGTAVVGAVVYLYGTEFVANSDADGGFSFPDAPVGPGELLVSKNGYVPARKGFICRSGEPATLDVELRAEPPPPPNYRHEPQPLQGRIGCSVRIIWYSLGNDPCHTAGLTPQATPGVTFVPPAGRVTGIMVELTWEPATIASARDLTLSIPRPDFRNFTHESSGTFLAIDPMRATGASPLRVTLEADVEAGEWLYEFNDLELELTFGVKVPVPTQAQFLSDPTGPSPADAVADQTYYVSIVLFYFGEPVVA